MNQFLLQMAGLPGTGKTTIAGALAQRTGAIRIDKDIIMAASMRAGVEDTISGAAAYEVGLDLASSILAASHSVILDSPANFLFIREKGCAVARRAGAVYRLIECVVPDRTLAEARIKSRRQLHSLHPATLVGVDLNFSRPGTGALTEPHLEIDTSRPLEVCLSEALEYLQV